MAIEQTSLEAHALAVESRTQRGRWHSTALACASMMASGFAGLAYQIVWTQQSTSWVGHESAAVLAVISAFFGGLALGALTLGPRIDRSARPARWYATCEIVIGLWSLALAVLLEPASSALLTLIGPQPTVAWHWSVTFLGTLLLLLPATMAMGATLPAMDRVLATTSSRRFSISALYAANTAGAVVGVLAAAFWLVPQLGLARSAMSCALLNFACAAAALRLQTGDCPTPTRGTTNPPGHPLLLLAATGLLGIGYEVLVVRALSQVAENTVYTFALLLSVYLIGTALGAAMYARYVVNHPKPGDLRNTLMQTLAGTCLLGTLLLAGANATKTWILEALGPSVPSALAGEATIAALAFLLPTMAMGALFSHLCTSARDAGISFGRAIGVNTLGAAPAPLLFGVVLLPLLGLKSALILTSAGYLLLAARHSWAQRRHWTIAAAAAACLISLPSPLNVHVPANGRLVSHTEGIMASVSVVEHSSGVSTLHINNRQQEGSSATLLADARQAMLPILLHPAPRQALFLGLGTGLTASSATLHPSLQVDAVELVPEVIDASTRFASSYADGVDLSRMRVTSADARRFVRTSKHRYDVIVADNFHPARSGSASLYTVEHFQSVRQRLADGGVFCQWLPLHQLDLDTLRSIVRSYLAVFPHGAALLSTHSLETPTLGLISRRDGERFNVAQLRVQLVTMRAHASADPGIADDLALLGHFIGGPQSLSKFAGTAPLNTDDRPIVAYRAPGITYSPVSAPRDRLLTLLEEIEIAPDEILAANDDADWRSRLVAYWAARNRFLAAGRDVRLTSDVREMLAQVREPLLAVLRISPDFRPAYDPLLRMAAELGRLDPAAARSLLLELQAIQPARPEAAAALQALAAATRSGRLRPGLK